MMFLAALVIVGFYFEKRRSVAATLAMCGSGVGMAVVAPFIAHLLNEFEWKGCVALISGLVLQGLVLGECDVTSGTNVSLLAGGDWVKVTQYSHYNNITQYSYYNTIQLL